MFRLSVPHLQMNVYWRFWPMFEIKFSAILKIVVSHIFTGEFLENVEVSVLQLKTDRPHCLICLLRPERDLKLSVLLSIIQTHITVYFACNLTSKGFNKRLAYKFRNMTYVLLIDCMSIVM